MSKRKKHPKKIATRERPSVDFGIPNSLDHGLPIIPSQEGIQDKNKRKEKEKRRKKNPYVHAPENATVVLQIEV